MITLEILFIHIILCSTSQQTGRHLSQVLIMENKNGQIHIAQPQQGTKIVPKISSEDRAWTGISKERILSLQSSEARSREKSSS